jgi:L-2,4-diaminobutyrate decarboxylase
VDGATSRHLLNRSSIDSYVETVRRSAHTLGEHLHTVQKPYSGASLAEVHSLVDAVDLDHPLENLDAVLGEVARLYLDHAVWFHDPGYVSHLNCPVALPALAAEVLISAVNSSVDTWDQSTAGTLIERRLIDWTAGRIGFGPDADGVFTSGGTQSNFQALLLAREEALAEVAERGPALSRLRVLATVESHFSIAKSAAILGLAEDAVVAVATDSGGRMDPTALERELIDLRHRGLTPMAVVATAGTTDLGRIDPIRPIAAACTEHEVWLHVDAAYGGGLLISPRRRRLLNGIEWADSVTVDFHKTFFQPVSSSAILVRRSESLRRIAVHADYLNPSTAAVPNQVDKSLQTTRRLDALKLWMTLRTIGAEQLGTMFDRVIDLAAKVHHLLVEDSDFEVAATPTLSTVLFRYRPDWMHHDDCDQITPKIRDTLFSRGEVVVASTTHAGRSWLKFTLLNPDTTIEDLRDILNLIREAGREMLDREHPPLVSLTDLA